MQSLIFKDVNYKLILLLLYLKHSFLYILQKKQHTHTHTYNVHKYKISVIIYAIRSNSYYTVQASFISSLKNSQKNHDTDLHWTSFRKIYYFIIAFVAI